MKADVIPEDGWTPTNMYFSVDRMDPIIKKDIHLVKAISNGRDKPKTPLERLQHMWEFDDGMRRQSWDKKSYRLIYRKIVLLWNMHMEIYSWKWCHIEFINSLLGAAQCGQMQREVNGFQLSSRPVFGMLSKATHQLTYRMSSRRHICSTPIRKLNHYKSLYYGLGKQPKRFLNILLRVPDGSGGILVTCMIGDGVIHIHITPAQVAVPLLTLLLNQ